MTSESTTPKPAEPTKRKTSLLKWMMRGFLAVVILLIVGVAVLYFMRNTLVQRGVVFGGKYATDQETTLSAADLAVVGGKLGLSQLQIANVLDKDKSYKEPYLLTMKDSNIEVETGSLLSGTVVVNSINITGLEVFVEQNGFKNNLADLMEVLKKKSPAASATPATGGGPSSGGSSAPESPGKKLQVKHLVLNGVKVHLRGIVTLDLDLGNIQMDDLTNPDGRAVKIADVIAKVLLRVSLQIMQQIANDPRIPAQFKDGLKNVNALVNGLKGDLLKGDLAENLKKFNLDGLKDAGGQLQNLGKDAGKQLQGLQNLIPGAKTKP